MVIKESSYYTPARLEGRISAAKSKRGAPGSPLGGWIDNAADDLGLTVRDLSSGMGFHERLLSRIRIQRRPTANMFSEILLAAEGPEFISEKQKESLRKAIAETAEGIAEKYGSIVWFSPTDIKNTQRSSTGQETYTGEEAARILGVTRQTVRRWRNLLKMPYLLSPAHIQTIGEHIGERKKAA